MGSQTILEMLRIGWVAGFMGPSMICFSIGALFYYGKVHRGLCLMVFVAGMQLLLSGLNIEMRVNGGQLMNVSFVMFVISLILILIGAQIELRARLGLVKRSHQYYRASSQNIDSLLVDEDDDFSNLKELRN